ncbi:MAG: tyrosine-type recombinase/integrase [Treponema sp.]|nr:tyrosine-type recombinase/integrase [Treponema sp.]
MNQHHTYTLYRDLKHSPYWYYLAYSPDDIRTCGHSTGCTSKTAARNYCDDLLKRGLLYNGINLTFEQYAYGWFDDGSAWMQDRLACGTPDHPALSPAYIMKLQSDLRLYLLPYFAGKKLQNIKPSDVKHFRTWCIQEKKLAFKTINNTVSTFRIITDTALADNVIMFDPLRGIRPLVDVSKTRDAFTLKEAQKIFSAEWKSKETKLVNFTAALTGMRISEILGIRKENLHKTYIDLSDQFHLGRLSPLKTKEARKIPIPQELYEQLLPLCSKGFAFHENDPQRPYIHLRYVLTDIGMESAREKRHLCFHSWRHFFNTYLLAENVPPVKVAAVLGHSTGAGSMQERYTNWNPDMFPEVYAAQVKLIKLLQP